MPQGARYYACFRERTSTIMAAEVKRIALAIPQGWEYSYRLIEGVMAFQDEQGGYLLRDFLFSRTHFERPAEPPTWEGWHPDGILSAVGREQGLAEWLLSSGLPIVNVSADVPPDLIPCVHATGAGKLAIEHFVLLGYRHIAHIGARGVVGSQRRYENLAEKIRAAGREPLCYELENDPVGSIDAQLKVAASEPGLIEFLSSAPKPLAVCALNDDFARCVCMACHGLGFEIPAEVAVLGVDDTSIARLNVPPLSSIRSPGEKVGYEAMKLLDAIMCGGVSPTEPILVPCDSMAVRESTQQREDVSIERAVRLIEAEACRGLSVGDLVNLLGVSRSSFEKRFTQQVGRTPGQEIQRVKIQHAQRLLSQTELSVTRIAGMVGFSRSSVFGTFFKKSTGITPSEYRRGGRTADNRDANNNDSA